MPSGKRNSLSILLIELPQRLPHQRFCQGRESGEGMKEFFTAINWRGIRTKFRHHELRTRINVEHLASES